MCSLQKSPPLLHQFSYMGRRHSQWRTFFSEQWITFLWWSKEWGPRHHEHVKQTQTHAYIKPGRAQFTAFAEVEKICFAQLALTEAVVTDALQSEKHKNKWEHLPV